MSSAEKIAISLDPETLAEAERLRAKTGESRSALFARAVRALVSREDHAEKVRRYVHGYERRPEMQSEAWHEAARNTLASQDW
ncbi:MAG: ribbon-helix-helix protein, CopG family [Myxococcota bacterium]